MKKKLLGILLCGVLLLVVTGCGLKSKLTKEEWLNVYNEDDVLVLDKDGTGEILSESMKYKINKKLLKITDSDDFMTKLEINDKDNSLQLIGEITKRYVGTYDAVFVKKSEYKSVSKKMKAKIKNSSNNNILDLKKAKETYYDNEIKAKEIYEKAGKFYTYSGTVYDISDGYCSIKTNNGNIAVFLSKNELTTLTKNKEIKVYGQYRYEINLNSISGTNHTLVNAFLEN